MSDQTNRIFNKVFGNEELIKVHTLHSKSLERNTRRNEKFCQRDFDENKNSTIQQNDGIIIFLFNNFEMQK